MNNSFQRSSTFLILFLLFFCVSTPMFAQTYVNKEWQRTTGIPDGTDWTATVLDADKNLLLVGNTVVSPNNANVLVTKYNAEGTTLWQRTLAGNTGGNDYGVAVTTDAQNNVYVAAALTVANGMFDFAVVKYNAEGTMQWTATWDNGLQDIPTAITLDDAGNIVVIGATTSLTQQINYAVVKWNTEGVRLWATEYDFAGLYDFPTAVEKASNTYIVVTGASANASNSWDYATLLVNSNTGQIENVNRVTVPEVGMDKALAVTRDMQNNIYVTGYSERNGNKNIQTLKLNSNFGLEWVKNFDGAGLEDVAKSIGTDALGNVYVAGYTKTAQEGENYIVLKYDQNGNEVWQRTYKPQAYEKAEAADIEVLPTGEVYVAGQIQQGGAKDFATLKYTQDGNLEWEKRYEGYGIDAPTSIKADNIGNIYVSGISETTNGRTYETVKYEEVKLPEYTLFSPEGTAIKSQNQVIIKFNPAVVNLDFVDNFNSSKDLIVGKIDEVLKPNAANILRNTLSPLYDGNLYFLKLFPDLGTKDTMTLSRLNEPIPIPPFWSALSLVFDYPVDVDSLGKLLTHQYDIIDYAHPLYAVHLQSNDPSWNEQASLHATAQYQDAHINVEEAWQYETGKPFVKVAVYDEAAPFYLHNDFYTTNGLTNYKGSIYSSTLGDYIHFLAPLSRSNISMVYSDYTRSSGGEILGFSRHATPIAGIIGASRNNNIGIAGIAGGNNNEIGVSLYGINIIREMNAIPTNIFRKIVIPALENTSNFQPQRLSLNIGNHSWGTLAHNSCLETPNNYLLRDAIHYASRLKVTQVAARGNCDGAFRNYPATYHDSWVLSVSGTGTNGRFIQRGFNGEFTATSGFDNGLMWPDLVAPATDAIIYAPSCIRDFAPSTRLENGGINSYSSFNGTSAAAPHVTGVAALLMSYLNNSNPNFSNLAPEDIEFILKTTTRKTNVNPVDPNGNPLNLPIPNKYVGYGFLDAGKALRLVDKTTRRLHHFSSQTHNTQKTIELITPSPIEVTFDDDYILFQSYDERNNNIYSWRSIQGGTTKRVKIYKVQATIRHNLNAMDNILVENNIACIWERFSSSNTLANYYTDNSGNKRLSPYEYNKIISFNSNECILEGYVYEILDNNNNVIQRIPTISGNSFANSLNELHFHYSLITNGVRTKVRDLSNSLAVKISPNNTNGHHTIEFSNLTDPLVEIEIFDVLGRLIASEKIVVDNSNGYYTVNKDISQLANGMYIYHIKNANKIANIKVNKY